LCCLDHCNRRASGEKIAHNHCHTNYECHIIFERLAPGGH
jgi:hypothetical protein